MIDLLETQSQLADATAKLMRSYAVATVHTLSASACRGITLWTNLIQGTAGTGPWTWGPIACTWALPPFTSWAPLSEWKSWSIAPQEKPEPVAAAAPADSTGSTPPASAYSTYRSAGGHATAQVIMGT